MQITCARCHKTLEFSVDRPSFCYHCGSPLLDTPQDVPTLTVDPEAATLAPGERAGGGAAPDAVAGYRLLRELGSGGMGSVYEAEDSTTGRRVALKLITADYASSREAVERFRQEGRLASAIAHPRCVFVLAAEEEAGRPYIVMELMPGKTLQDLVDEKGPLPPEVAIPKILDVIEGLQEAHKLGVVHRDVKPSNCFLETDGHVKIGDFGLSKSLVNQAHLTKTGSFLGTPLFASPEQIKAEPVDPQSDVYSVAATLYYLLTGRAPHQTGDAAATLARIVADNPPPMRKTRPELSPALDKVVLRGLERDRSRRWRDLEEFRRALLPFVPGQLSMGSMGFRIGAYMLDYVFMMLLNSPISMILLGGDTSVWFDPAMVIRNLPLQLIGLTIDILYFAVLEGIWGASFGKRLVGLRVRTTAGSESPGFFRTLVRATLFVGLPASGMVASVIVSRWLFPAEMTTLELLWYTNVINGINFTGLVLGIGLLVCTMRTRNGYRGLHEFASGTRVVQLPWKVKRRTFATDRKPREEAHPADLPKKVGMFSVESALLWADEEKVFLAADKGLGRNVWVWLRPTTEPELPPSRRELSRPTRPRWLAGGVQGRDRWDAFLAPAGCTLPDLLVSERKFSWKDARPLLEQLTEELVKAEEDGTLPACLAVDQVWVQPDGSVQLLDFPLSGSSVQGTEQPAAAAIGEDRPAVRRQSASRQLGARDEDEQVPTRAAASWHFLRQAAVWMLEGRPRKPEQARLPLRNRLPQYAAGPLNQLLRGKAESPVQQFQNFLQKTRELPAEVSRLRRAACLAVSVGLMALGPCWCLLYGGFMPAIATAKLYFVRLEAQYNLEDLERQAAVDLTTTALNPHPLVQVKGAAQWQADQYVADQLRGRISRMKGQHELRLRSWIRVRGRTSFEGFEGTWEQQAKYQRELQQRRTADPPKVRRSAQWSAYREENEENDAQVAVGASAVLLGLQLLFAAGWAFAWRGGLSYRLTGIALVRSDGQPAGRFRCALRVLLVWLPIAALCFLSVIADVEYWSNGGREDWLPWASWGLWWLAALLLAGYAVLAIVFPRRSLHDYLTGTYLVPR